MAAKSKHFKNDDQPVESYLWLASPRMHVFRSEGESEKLLIPGFVCTEPVSQCT